jgi:serine/threonine-protein kinase RIM15
MYIKRHVRRRLAHAKESCDKELNNIIDSITAFVEERLQDDDDLDYGSVIAASETASEDGGDEADLDIPRSPRHSRHREFPIHDLL